MKRCLSLAGFFVLTLAGCASDPKPGSSEYAEIERSRAAAQAASVTEQAPTWYFDPAADDRFLYATGSAVSGDLDFAVAKAVLNAKAILADQVGGRISGQHKSFLTETSGDGKPAGTSERTLNNLVQPIALPGYQVVQRKVLAEGAQFRAFVMLRFAATGADSLANQKGQKTAAADINAQASAAQRELEHATDAAAAGLDVRHDTADKANEDPPAPLAVPRPPVSASRI